MWFKKESTQNDEHSRTIDRVKDMVNDSHVQRLAKKHGLNVVNVTWEDTARFKDSAVGPNISDLTIQIEEKDGPHGPRLSCMPVLRQPNFADVTADMPLDDFKVLVGNERGSGLRPVKLRRYLKDMRSFMSEPSSWCGSARSLLAPRDTKVLVSAQACFLPVPKKGKATFNPVLFNYQSSAGAPAVLCIVATREGTSATIIDNQRDGFSVGNTWGQRLFFNADGQRASMTGERLSDFVATPEGARAAAEQEALNGVMIIQIPLKIPQAYRRAMVGVMPESCAGGMDGIDYCQAECEMEAAVIGHGETEGDFVEVDGLSIRRDPRFPIRVTVQLYQATSTGQVSNAEMAGLAAALKNIYSGASHVGSLVTSGETGRDTEYTPSKRNPTKSEPAAWWSTFWRHYEKKTGQSQQEAWEMLAALRSQSRQTKADRDFFDSDD